ncbi:DUF5590 domain-containing protein [Brevibacillus choshinensis]|uniref:Cell wall elongation regulator TseB-like domain-containing protein n=2 Tax=Brevibacillus choshinensis TaxID=54911 RepID=A0ABR5NCS3_BRECH|nr:DUF5590 domain-containing protein [Brevibacillus choshinensis]KQL49337.1 hypothetical protein AN963_06130 [Brevibacillus choshinensis]MED4581363.1 DUF5590 domain-containing protein [Brevibacillus choshinensis]MED4751019.1 DUF5590 domain-containing protein [Brevibacillus choshinensis]MED4783149.1 DUF5590 domain-containing protein [Brevibacillus choshinensis]
MAVRITVVVIAALLLIGAGFTYHLTSSVVGERNSFDDQVMQWVQERTTISQVDSIDEYRGKQSYAVVLGKNNAGTPVVAWLTDKTAAFDRMDLAVPRKNVEAAVLKGFPQATITHIVPGLENEKRFWEVTLTDKDGRFHYLHYDLFNGTLLASYVLSPTS